MKKHFLYVAALTVVLTLVACKKETNANPSKEEAPQENGSKMQENSDNDSLEIKRKELAAQDSIAMIKKQAEAKKQAKKYAVYQGESYLYWPMKVSDSLTKAFYKKFNKEQIYIIAALNRIDTDHIKGRDTLIVPKELRTDFMSYSPFPHQMTVLDSVNKFAIFSYPIQAYALYENGKLVKWGPTNMGKKAHQTPRGLFFTNWKGRQVKSTSNDEWILNWNFNISNNEGVGWHQYAMPGYPASHSCLRLLDADAQWMYKWADQWVLEDKHTLKVKGTPVIVYGDYAFGKKGVWNDLVKNPNATQITEATLEGIIKPHLPEIMKQQHIRENYKIAKSQPEITVKDSLSKS